MSNYKAALVRISEYPPEIAISADGHCWYVAGPRLGSQHGWYADNIEIVRPLVVLDLDQAPDGPEFRGLYAEWVRFLGKYDPAVDNSRRKIADWIADQIEQQTRPPKPAEPKGRYAEVQDAEGYVWFRDPVGSWRRVDSPGHYVCHEWESVPAVGVLSEGVQP